MTTRPARRRLPDPGAVHDEREIEAVVAVLRESNLAIGERVRDFEHRVAELLAKRHGVMVNSGSSALRLAIDLLDLAPGDEVITPVVTFATDVAPLVQSGIVPAFVDVEPDSYQIDVDGVEEMVGPQTRAILAPNLVGNVPDWDRIREVADAHGLTVVEDSCDVLDAWLRGARTGTRADMSVTSFARGHAITAAGNGGLVGIDDDGLLDRCLTLRRWGRRSETYLFGSRQGEKDRFGPLADGTPYDLVFLFDAIGYNFEPSELGAAFGLVQLEKLADNLALRRRHFTRYSEFFAGHTDRVAVPRQLPDLETAWLGFPLMIEPDAGFARAELQEFLDGRGIDTRTIWTGNVTRQPMLGGVQVRVPDDGLPHADAVMERGVLLPLSHAFGDDTLDVVTRTVAEFLHSH